MNPPLPDKTVISTLPALMSRALSSCRPKLSVPEAEAGIDFSFFVEGESLHLQRELAGESLSTCLLKALQGEAFTGWGPERRRVVLQLRMVRTGTKPTSP